MPIIKATEPIVVERSVFLLVGQPGICKTSLGYSMPDPLLVDFDGGSHRAVNRRDTFTLQAWAEIDQLQRGALEPYASIVIDTVERCLQMMTVAIIADDPKCGARGVLTPKGWGVLKQTFATWIATLRSYGLDILLLAHAKEQKDDVRSIRADIQGGSYSEVLKVADFVGYLYMRGNDRVLDFNPCERWIGKNPAGWQPFMVPAPERAHSFMADLVARGVAALGHASEASATVAQHVDLWRQEIAALAAAPECNAILPRLKSLPAILQPQVKRLLWERSKALGVTFDASLGAFVAPTVAVVDGGAGLARPPVNGRAASWQPQLLSALTTQDGAR